MHRIPGSDRVVSLSFLFPSDLVKRKLSATTDTNMAIAQPTVMSKVAYEVRLPNIKGGAYAKAFYVT